jgi:septal ring-binding cell division protein DamX
MVDTRSPGDSLPGKNAIRSAANDQPPMPKHAGQRARSGSTEIARLERALGKLRDRVADLYALQRSQEESGARLSSRLGALEVVAGDGLPLSAHPPPTDHGADAGHTDGPSVRIEAPRAQTAPLGAGLARRAGESVSGNRPARATEVDVLLNRLAAVEAAVGSLRAAAGQRIGGEGSAPLLPEPIDRDPPAQERAEPEQAEQEQAEQEQALAGLEGKLEEALDAMRLQTLRLDQLQAEMQSRGTTADRRDDERRHDMSVLREAFETHNLTMRQAVEDARAYARRVRDTQQAWTDARLRRLAWRLTVAGGLAALALLVLVGATWWHADHRFGLTALQLENIEDSIEDNRRAMVPELAPMVAALSEGLGRLELRSEQLASRFERGLADARTGAGAVAAAGAADAASPSPGTPRPSQQVPIQLPQQLPNQPTETGDTNWPGAPVSGSLQARGAAPGVEGTGTVSASAQLPRPASPETTASGARVRPIPAAAAASTTPGADGAELVLATPRWVIQLIGYRSVDRARAFAADYGLSGQAWTEQGAYRGRPWYRVVTGNYADRGAALAVLDTLPPSLRALEPIARRLDVGTRLESLD